MRTKYIGIVAMTAERVIGKDGGLPWHLPEDLKFFKKTTLHSPIVMGRKTFDSIGRPLPKRQNIVITRDPHWTQEGVDVVHSLDELNALTRDTPTTYIIGGAEVYKLFLPEMDELIVSHIKSPYEGDTYFPSFLESFKTMTQIADFEKFSVIRYRK